MKKIITVFILLLNFTHTVLAEDVKIGFVNATRLMNEIPQATNLKEKLQLEFAPRDKKISDMQTDLKKIEDTRSKNASILTEENKSKLDHDILKLSRDIRRSREEYLEDLNIRRNEGLGVLQKLVTEAINSFAKSNNYDFIFSSSVLYASKRVDLTDELIVYLKNEYQASNLKQSQ